MGVFRNDILAERKSFHVTLDRDVYIQLRMLLFKYDITLPQFFTFVGSQVVLDNPKAKKILEDCIVHKLQRQMGGRKLNRKYTLPKQINEQDKNVIYNLIERYDATDDELYHSTGSEGTDEKTSNNTEIKKDIK